MSGRIIVHVCIVKEVAPLVPVVGQWSRLADGVFHRGLRVVDSNESSNAASREEQSPPVAEESSEAEREE